ncbi:MAG: hypothetical protein OEZ39_10420 [Gammaproteobacteria bacterium]|nr:hypothetical protein [Gammaproteobacteria bacterium]MDH5652256.1 hypothetical protein [Gammaproteobacteria bacterium]
MKLSYLLILLVLTSVSCTRTENGIVFGIPDYEKRSLKVSITDLKILQQTKLLLANSGDWTNDNVRSCTGSPPYNLYCALEKASITIAGQYIHRRPALQEVRFVIDELFRKRWKVHRLADFNAHPMTTFDEVIMVIDKATDKVKLKLASNQQ